ncbi:MAG TPA: beta-N-acetylglucosaminidase domain-containing protein [Candidatus Binatia bacterium]|jgi:hyaluronoglucosaminidase
MNHSPAFERRGIVEGFFGPPWSLKHRTAIFEFGAARGMNTYLYAPKDDPYHREKWRQSYPPQRWKEMERLVRCAQRCGIDFVYGFHPGKGLLFSSPNSIAVLLAKAQRFYDAGVRTFAVLFDDIPSRLTHEKDRKRFTGSLARAEGWWLAEILNRQPGAWSDVDWWICPSYYSEDPLLARVFGRFEDDFLERLSETLPLSVAFLWTGPQIVSKKIGTGHIRRIRRQIGRRLILWDNYPVNDLSMRNDMNLGPLSGRDANLPDIVYGYLNNPLLQETLSFVPLGTCFDYARRPADYDPERSWRRTVLERYGSAAVPHWRAIRKFCEQEMHARKKKTVARVTSSDAATFRAALKYVRRHRRTPWARELEPWMRRLQNRLTADIP